MTDCMKVVCQKRLNCGFSMQKIHPSATAHWTSLDVKKYNLLALGILRRSTKLRLGNPFGCLSDRNGLGAGGSPGLFLLSGIDLALEADPQGGAINIPTTFLSDSHCISKLTPASVVRLAIATWAAACLCRT